MFKKYFIIFFVGFYSVINAQEESKQFIKSGLVRADGSLIAGYMFKENLSNVHLGGDFEYYLDNRISIKGAASSMIGSSGLTSDSIGLKDFTAVYLGAVYHFTTKGNFDPYLVLQPGIAYTASYKEINASSLNNPSKTETYSGAVSPLATAGIGFNYYFERYFHLFMETRYVYGKHLSVAPHPISLQELRITFGLGFNLFIKNKK